MPLSRALLLLLIPTSAWAADISLFASTARPAVQKYDDLVINLRPGDCLHFSNGKSFTIEALIGGRTSQVFTIKERSDRVLRISFRHDQQGYLQAYADAYLRLKQEGVPVPRLDIENSLRGEYILQEKVEIRALLTEVNSLPKQEFDRAMEALIQFAAATAQFEWIGDFRADQLAWNGRDWILLDWTDAQIYFAALNWQRARDSRADHSLFGVKFSERDLIPKEILKQIKTTIAQIREKRACENQMFSVSPTPSFYIP